jgi:uncharacterized protein
MATMNPYIPERRQIMDRRGGVGAASAMGANRMGATRTDTQDSSGSRAMNAVDWLAMALLIIGGLNWGAVGLLGVDFVADIFGDGSLIARAIYVLVGLSALYSIYTATKMSHTHT